VLAVAALSVTVRGDGTTGASPGADDTVAMVDGVAIPVRELGVYLSQDRSGVIDYFEQHFGTHDSGSFWTTRFGGQTPTDRLEAAALADATRTTVQFALAYRTSW
jgi:hypothetical protein